MAKKKGRRSTNVARKREKRNRDRKSRQKQLALEKQRRLLYAKSEEEHLHACIAESQKLLDEPELAGVLFDPQLMQQRVVEVLNDLVPNDPDAPIDKAEGLFLSEIDAFYPTNANTDETQLTRASKAEQACDHFRLEILPHLFTPDFMERLTQALTACETRLTLTGNRELAEVAFVTRSLFEAAPSEILAFHPMIQTIGIETLRVLVEEMDVMIDGGEEVKGILSDVLAQEDSEPYLSQPASVFSNAGLDKDRKKSEDAEPDSVKSVSHDTESEAAEEVDIEDTSPALKEAEMPGSAASANPSESEPVALPETAPPELTLSPDELPARALYKNFNGLTIKEHFEASTDGTPLQEGLANYALVNENEKQIEFADVENERYITVTKERLQLHARSEAELAIAMEQVEAHCTSAVMYLAKTLEERG